MAELNLRLSLLKKMVKIIIKNAVERKPGYLYSIDAEGSIIESVGPGGPMYSTLRIAHAFAGAPERTTLPTTRKTRISAPGAYSTLSNPSNCGSRRLSKIQKEILQRLHDAKYPYKIEDLVKIFQNNYHASSVYRSIDNLHKKGFIVKGGNRKSWYEPLNISLNKDDN